MSRTGEMEFLGGKYTGEISTDSGLPHGTGKIVFHSQNTAEGGSNSSGGGGNNNNGEQHICFYEGEWVDGKAHGKGVQGGWIGPDRSFAYLDLILDRIHSNISGGLHSAPNDPANEKECVNVADHLEVLHGEFRYEGTFVDGEMSGTGQFTFPNGDLYDGEWQRGLAHGHGMFIWSNGDMYQGEFRYMMKHGTGTYIFKDGTKYDGQWRDNMRHGWGVETFAKGNGRYEGYFCKDVRHGIGYYHIGNGGLDGSGSGGKRGHKSRKNMGGSSGGSSGSMSGSSGSLVSPGGSPGSPTLSPISGHTIIETVWDFGRLVSQREVDAAPSVPPPEPKELKDDSDRALELIDELMQGKEIDEDNVFVEGILHWNDTTWFTIENLFVDVFVERVRLLSLQNQLADIEDVSSKLERKSLLETQLEKLRASLGSTDKMKSVLLQCMSEGDESLPGDDAEETEFQALVESKIKALEDELNTIKAAEEKVFQKYGSDAIDRHTQLKQEIIELEKKLFRIDSSIATARLHGSAVASPIDTSHAKYKDLLKLTCTLMTRLAWVAEKMVMRDHDEENLAEMASKEVLQKANTQFCQEIELKSEFKALGCDIRRTMERSTKLLKMTLEAVN